MSVEDRCCAVPERLFSNKCRAIELLEINDPPDAFPDYSELAGLKMAKNRKRLKEAGIVFQNQAVELLASEDKLLDLLANWEKSSLSPTIILDITSLPKRYFCFIIKRLLLSPCFPNVIATYTQTGPNGYTPQHLAEDPMTCDHLPGYSAPLPPKGSTLVVSVGFESLSISSLLGVYRDMKKDTKVILSFPSNRESIRREWNTVRQMALGDARNIKRENIEVIPAWDAEQVYHTLKRWQEDSDGLTLAPFGPKPHSLGMALFAIKYDAGLYYTQPRSYNPDYSKGQAESSAYVVKWGGIACFDRQMKLP
ncbi:hypothetical protein HY626_01185 [Candidatus Uhrbacteria bacterium]|nr:hypothetical protein [Candidatus Uhrbacteria bacterium]